MSARAQAGRCHSGTPVAMVLAAMDEAWRQYRDAEYARAVEATRGCLLSAAGLAAGINDWDLFVGPHRWAVRWASEELREYWQVNGRWTRTEFEEHYFRHALAGVIA